jgi:hypothetical protein
VQFLNYLILLAIAIIWRPNPNNGRYAYEELVSHIDDDGETGEGGVDMEMEDMQAVRSSPVLNLDIVMCALTIDLADAQRDTALGIEEDDDVEFSRQESDETSPNSGNPYKSKEESSYGA